MNRNENIGFAAARLGHAHTQRDKHVFVARHVHLIAEPLHFAFGFARNRKHYVFFAQAAGADRTGIFAAVAGVEHYHQLAVAAPVAAGMVLHRRHAGGLRLRGGGAVLADTAVGVVLQERHQRVVGFLRQRHGLGGIEVDHQAVFEIGYRREREHLRVHGGFQIHHHADGVRVELPHADTGHIRVAAAELLRQALHHAVEARALNVHHQAARVVQQEIFMLQGAGGFERGASVGRGRPNAHGHKLRRAVRFARGHNAQEQQAGAAA